MSSIVPFDSFVKPETSHGASPPSWKAPGSPANREGPCVILWPAGNRMEITFCCNDSVEKANLEAAIDRWVRDYRGQVR